MLKAPYILLAEDSDDDSFFAQRCFAGSTHPFEVRRCLNGKELVAVLQDCGQNMPQAVILDLKMPMMNGFEALEWIRRQTGCKALPVYVLSSSPLQEDIERARRLGATEYLVKPTSFLDLQQMIRKLAERISAPEH